MLLIRRTRNVRVELGHDGAHIPQRFAWPIRIVWLINESGPDQMSQQLARLSCTNRRARRRRRLTFPLDSVAAVYRGCGAGCRANKNTKPPLVVQCPPRRAAGMRATNGTWDLHWAAFILRRPPTSSAFHNGLARLQWRKIVGEELL